MTESSGWQLANINGVEARERYTMAVLGNAWAQELVQLAAPAEGDRVLDVACGTGVVARYAAPLVGPTGSVTGLDLNAGMLTVARTMPQRDGVAIVWREGDATALPFPNASFDLVCCREGLQYIPDRSAALKEMHRVLRPGGRLALSVWRSIDHSPFHVALSAALLHYVSAEAAANVRAPVSLGQAEELRGLITAAGFHTLCLRIRSRFARYPSLGEYVLGFLAGTPMAGAVAALEASTRTAMVQQVCTALREYVDDEGMAVPWEAHMVTAHA